MYHALLTNRYLTSRVIPLIAVAAVALCVALVIIVVSVMTGFLNMVRASGRILMGDVVVSYRISGIPSYADLIERIESLPEAEAASPVVDSWGLLQMPYPPGPQKEVQYVQVWGIEPESFARVTGFDRTLYWKPLSEEEEQSARAGDFRRLVGDDLARFHEAGRRLENPSSDLPAIVLGMHVSIGNDRQKDGTYEPKDGFWFMPNFQVVLTVLPVVGHGMPEPRRVSLQVVNEFVSGVFLIDRTRVMIPLAVAQERLHLDGFERLDDDDNLIGREPPRATMILVRAADGVDPRALRDAVARAYEAFEAAHREDLAPPPDPRNRGLTVRTWAQQQAEFIAPVEKERELMRTLFSLVYLVCAGLVLSIFWAIVYEKTRDIGILRSMGATRLGISWIFLRYGLVIGVLGAIAGLGLGVLIVRNINAIHAAMGDPPQWLVLAVFAGALGGLGLTIVRARSGRLLPLVGGLLLTLTLLGAGVGILVIRHVGGVVIWDPAVYYFTHIPNDLDRQSALITMVGAVLFSLLGAFLPAARAADTDPVRALRYE